MWRTKASRYTIGATGVLSAYKPGCSRWYVGFTEPEQEGWQPKANWLEDENTIRRSPESFQRNKGVLEDDGRRLSAPCQPLLEVKCQHCRHNPCSGATAALWTARESFYTPMLPSWPAQRLHRPRTKTRAMRIGRKRWYGRDLRAAVGARAEASAPGLSCVIRVKGEGVSQQLHQTSAPPHPSTPTSAAPPGRLTRSEATLCSAPLDYAFRRNEAGSLKGSKGCARALTQKGGNFKQRREEAWA